MKNIHSVHLLILSLLLLFSSFVPGKTVAETNEADLAKHLIELGNIPRGICALIGSDDSQLGLEIARTDNFLVHIIDSNSESIDPIKKKADEEGLYGRNLVAETITFENELPFAENTIDLIINTRLTKKGLNSSFLDEIIYTLRPQGIAILGIRKPTKSDLKPNQIKSNLKQAGIKNVAVFYDGFGVWAKITKPELEGVDDWSHWEHAPDNNPVSTDKVIKAPYMTKWMGTPYYIAMPAITTAAGGRIFIAMGHIAHHKREEPWLNTLVAQNGYNGTELWTRKLPDGYLAHRSAFIATKDTFYMIDTDGNGVILIDPETGWDKRRIDCPEITGEWKWIALNDGILYALVGDYKDPPETTIVRSEYTHWSWGELSRGYYQKRVPWGFGKTLLAYDLKQDKLLWTHKEESPVDSRAMVMGGGKLYFYGPDSHIGCLDTKNGRLDWTNDDKETRELIEEPGRGLISTPGFRTMCYSIHTPEALFYEAQTRMNIVAVSKKDGSRLWHRRKTSNNPNMIYLDGQLYVGIGPEGNTLILDPMTGKTISDLGFKKRSCARLTATPDSLFCRGWPEGLTRFDRQTKEILFNGAFRPSCNDGVIGANGLLYLGPWACDCNLSLMGRVALSSAGDFQFEREPNEPEQLTHACDDVTQIESFIEIKDNDWPTYRGNNNRSGSTQVRIPENVNKLWTYQPDHEYTPTAPVSAGEMVFVCGDDGKVRAISAANGQLKWSFLTTAPILQPPTIWNNRVYVGSSDGYIYALEAASGSLLWRFRAAPVERRIPVYGSICSTWPVNSGVIIDDGVAYAAAGIIDYDGTYVYALDAITGKVKWQNNSSGHLDKKLRKGISAQGNLTIAQGRLWMPGGNVVSPAAYDLQSGEYRGDSPGNGSPRANRGEDIAFFNDKYILLGGRLRYSAAENVVNPGNFLLIDPNSENGIGKTLRLNEGKIPPAWNKDKIVFVDGRYTVPVCCDVEAVDAYFKNSGSKKEPDTLWKANALNERDVISLVLSQNSVLTVCETPRHRNLTPAWTLCTLDNQNGSIVWRHNLSSKASPGGLLADKDGRVVIVLQDGGIECYGGVKPLQSYIHSIKNMTDHGTIQTSRAVQLLRHTLKNVHTAHTRKLVMDSISILGAEVGEEAKKDGYIIHWNLIGPVPWNANNSVDHKFVNEPSINLNKNFTIKNKSLGWKEYVTDHPTGMVDLENIYGPNAGVAAYAYAEIQFPEEKDLLLKIGSNDGFKCWFNEKEVGRFDGGRGYMPDQDTLQVKCKKGTNTILLKITQQGAAWAFSARLTDKSGKPVT